MQIVQLHTRFSSKRPPRKTVIPQTHLNSKSFVTKPSLGGRWLCRALMIAPGSYKRQLGLPHSRATITTESKFQPFQALPIDQNLGSSRKPSEHTSQSLQSRSSNQVTMCFTSSDNDKYSAPRAVQYGNDYDKYLRDRDRYQRGREEYMKKQKRRRNNNAWIFASTAAIGGGGGGGC